MKKNSFLIVILLCISMLYAANISAQTVTATYTAGNGNTDYSFTALPGASTCPLSLSVTIPAGAVITATAVSYSMTGQSAGYMSEQRSQLRCTSAGGTAEATLYSGVGSTTGTYAYNRTGLNIANGVAGGGTINFQLHAGRTWGGSGCNTTYNYVNNNWTITVTYFMPVACSGTPNNGVAAISSTTGCVGTNFTVSATGLTLGTGVTYQWQSAPSATGPWTNIVGATGSSYTTSLATTTFYQINTTCSNSGITSTSNVVSYTVTGNACQCGTYPAVYASSTADEEITNVTIGTLNNSSTCATLAPGPGSIVTRYSNYTGFVAAIVAQLGETLNFSLTQTSCGGSYGNGFQIYIDYNQDGDFMDAGEQVYNQPVAATGNHTKTGSFTIPATATQGITRLRVVNVESGFPIATNYSSTAYTWGETEDYCINIIASTPCAGTPEAGSASPATQQISTGSTTTISLVGVSAVSGLTYQWQQSASAGGPFANVVGGSGATTPTYTTPAVSVDTYYRCIVTCTATALTDISAVGEVTVVATVNMFTGSITTCGSLFYDSGGAAANYAVSENYTLTIYPSTPGSQVRVTFSSYVTESSYEYLRIYNGNSTAAPLLATYTGTATIPVWTSTAIDGSLTFNFTSDGSVQYAGWVASITCYNPCVFFTPAFTAAGPYCSGATIPTLPTTSNDGVTGAWSPAINNMATTTYTFTPNPGQCALNATMTITVNPNTPALFTPVGPYCPNDAIPALPLTSNDGITGTWSPAIDNMLPTTYTFVANGGVCATTSLTIDIDTFPSGITNNSGTTELTCSMTHISLTATGGGTYSWYGGVPNVLASTTISTPATYTVTINGTNGCSQTESITITQDIIAPVATITNNTGTTQFICSIPSINVTAGGGASYLWSGGATPSTADNTFTSAGTYTVTVTGSNGCTATQSITLTQAAPLTIVETVTDALCFGFDGVADIQVTAGGNTPYSIVWDDASVSFTNNNVPSNVTFAYTITDGDLCTTSGDVFVNDPDLLTASATGTNVSCFGAGDGMIDDLVAVGGTPPYSYLWSNGETTQIVSSLIPGNYIVTVSDFNGCTAIASATITQPPQLFITLTSTDAECGADGGTIDAIVSGGIPGYVYNWSETGYGGFMMDLAPGDYTLTVTDANLCPVEETITVGKIGGIVANINITHPISCGGVADGSLEGSSVNGANPLAFRWSNGASTQNITDLNPGTFHLTVTDDWGCEGFSNVTLTVPDAIALDYAVTDLTCYGINDGKIYIGLTGGAPPFTIMWSVPGNYTSINSLAPGPYSVTVTDTRNCSITQDFTVSQPAEMILDFTKSDVTCNGMNDGHLTMLASGGSEPYYYTVWTNTVVAIGQEINSLSKGNYTIHVKDNNNCTTSEAVYIGEPAPLEASVLVSNPSCMGSNDGFIQVVAAGGTEPYSYYFNEVKWFSSTYGNLVEGVYEVAVSDTSGCSYEVGKLAINDSFLDCVLIPTAFSPNSDGINDKWEIRNFENYPGAQVQVFNRWGQPVYSATSGQDPWDGTFDGKFVISGPYLYYVNLKNDTDPYTGTVTVVY